MDGPRGYPSEWHKSDKQRQILYDIYVEFKFHIFYVEFKKIIQMNIFTKQKQTHRHREKKNKTYGYQRGKAGVG